MKDFIEVEKEQNGGSFLEKLKKKIIKVDCWSVEYVYCFVTYYPFVSFFEDVIKLILCKQIQFISIM